MRYRLEILKDDEIVVHNVETGLILGTVIPHFAKHSSDPHRQVVSACNVLNHAGEDLAWISRTTVPSPLIMAPIAVATHEAHYGHPGVKAHAAEPCRPNRIEDRLGALLTDLGVEVARGAVEFQNGGVEGATKERCSGLIADLYAVWRASRFGSFDDGTRLCDDPYFSNPTPSGPRMTFAQAAQHYGMNELRRRFPGISDETLRELLAWPLELLRDTLNRLLPGAAPADRKV